MLKYRALSPFSHSLSCARKLVPAAVFNDKYRSDCGAITGRSDQALYLISRSTFAPPYHTHCLRSQAATSSPAQVGLTTQRAVAVVSPLPVVQQVGLLSHRPVLTPPVNISASLATSVPSIEQWPRHLSTELSSLLSCEGVIHRQTLEVSLETPKDPMIECLASSTGQ